MRWHRGSCRAGIRPFVGALVMVLIHFFRSADPGSAPDPGKTRPRGIGVNVADRTTVYLDEKGNPSR